jgi:RNase P subunit RPR2
MDTLGFSILYRCDAPHVRRLFRLSIQPEDKGALKLNHTLVHSKKSFETRKVLVFKDHYDCTRCSVCCSFLVGENWIDTASLPDERYFPKSFGVCPDCRDTAIKEIQRRSSSEGSNRLTNFQSRQTKDGV